MVLKRFIAEAIRPRVFINPVLGMMFMGGWRLWIISGIRRIIWIAICVLSGVRLARKMSIMTVAL